MRLLLIALLVAGDTTPTIGSLKELPPSAVGDIVLAGHDHGAIVVVEPLRGGGMFPPGFYEMTLIERGKPNGKGCVRTRWHASFASAPGEGRDAAKLGDVYASTEVAVATSTGCAGASYAALNAGLTVKEAIAALTYLDRLRDGTAKADISCVDRVHDQTHPCRSNDSIRRALSGPIKIVESQGDAVAISIGPPLSGAYIEVRYPRSDPRRVRLVYDLVPPF